MSLQGLKLFDLMPALYRLKDARLAQLRPLLTAAEQAQVQALQALSPPLAADQQQQLDELTAKAARGPLESLLMIVEEQLAVLAEDLDQLYDDQFIETCAPWVIPYIGDLIGYQAVNGIAPAVASPRAEVANTISFRRRKGTVLVMEQLARDVTGWGAHAVEMFQVLGDTQYMNHIRPQARYGANVRDWKTGLYIDTGFDQTLHRVDVRRIASRRGRYNIQNIGIFLWSLTAYSLTKAPATAVANTTQCFRVSSLGCDTRLFNNPVPQGPDITAPATPVNVTEPLRRRVLCADLQGGAGAAYYGEGNSLALYSGGQLLEPYQVQVCNLSGADGSWINLPAAGGSYLVAIDPELGRIAIPPPPAGTTPDIRTSFYYGFNAPIGGGEYAREAGFTVQNDAWVLPFPDTAAIPRYATLQQALTYAVAQLALNGQVAVQITDSGIYGAATLTAELPAGTTLELRAAEGHRPTLILDGEINPSGAASSVFQINGLVIAYSAAPANPIPSALLHVPPTLASGNPNLLSQVTLTHCTLVPGWTLNGQAQPAHPGQPALIAEPSGVEVVAANCILGGMQTSALATASLTNTILDATGPTGVAYAGLLSPAAGGALTLVGCTVIGKVHATELNIDDSIVWAQHVTGDGFNAALWSDRRQAGCVRFSFLPPGAITPRRYECVQQVSAGPQPLFFSLRYGDPAYAKLLASTPDVVRRGAHDGGEMGAFHFVLAPLRESDLLIRLQEYVPVEMEFGVIYQN